MRLPALIASGAISLVAAGPAAFVGLSLLVRSGCRAVEPIETFAPATPFVFRPGRTSRFWVSAAIVPVIAFVGGLVGFSALPTRSPGPHVPVPAGVVLVVVYCAMWLRLVPRLARVGLVIDAHGIEVANPLNVKRFNWEAISSLRYGWVGRGPRAYPALVVLTTPTARDRSSVLRSVLSSRCIVGATVALTCQLQRELLSNVASHAAANAVPLDVAL